MVRHSILHSTNNVDSVARSIAASSSLQGQSEVKLSEASDPVVDPQSLALPALQFAVIAFVRRVLETSPFYLRFLREYRLYDVLFSSYFFFLGDKGTGDREDTQTSSSSTLAVNSHLSSTLMRLQHDVLSLARFTATLDESECVEEVKYLIRVLEYREDDDDIVIAICQCLIALFRHRLRKAQLAVLAIDGMPTIARIITTQQKASRNADGSRPFLFLSRLSVLKVLDCFLSTRDIQLFVLKEFYAVNIVFSLMLEEEPFQSFGMRLISSLMVVTGPKVVLTPSEVAVLDSDSATKEQDKRVYYIVETLHHAKEALVEKFVETIPKVLANKSVCMALFQTIRNVLSMHTFFHQNLFCTKRIFIQVVNVLSHQVCLSMVEEGEGEEEGATASACDSSAGPTPSASPMSTTSNASSDWSGRSSSHKMGSCTSVAIQVLRTLTALMQNNPGTQEKFSKDIGYDELAKLLLRAEGKHPSRELFASLFDMLVDGDFVPNKNYIIQNPEVITLLFRLLPKCEPIHQLQFLTTFTSIVARSSLNQSYCCSVNLLDILLDLFCSFPLLDVNLVASQMSRPSIDIATGFVSQAGIRQLGAWTEYEEKEKERERRKAQSRRYRGISSSSADPTSNLHQPSGAEGVALDNTVGVPDGYSDILKRKAIQLMQIVGTHSLTVKQLKRFFSLMKSTKLVVDVVPGVTVPANGSASSQLPSSNSSSSMTSGSGETGPVTSIETRCPYNADLLEAIEQMTMKEGPNNFFYFDGVKSGLAIPEIEKWPSHGYAFSTWIRVESYSHPRPHSVPKKFHQPRLFCFLTSDGCGVECFFDNERLILQVTTSRNKTFIYSMSQFTLKPRRWYHLVISHSVGMFGSNEVRMYVDGVAVEIVKNSKYPSVNAPLKRCYIGSDNSHPKPQAFFGEMGPVYIFEDYLTDKQVAAIYSLGASYMFTFEQVLDGQLSAKIFLAYNSNASKQGRFLDNTPRSNRLGSTRMAGMHATYFPGTHQCVTRHVGDVLHCLGGISVFFPLFAQLDYPVAVRIDKRKKGSGRKLEEEQDKDTDNLSDDRNVVNVYPSTSSTASASHRVRLFYDTDPRFLENLLRTLAVMVQDNPINQAFVRESRGFAVVSQILENVSPRNLTVSTAEALGQVVAAAGFDEALHRQAFYLFLANFQIWVYTDSPVQRYWARLLSSVVSDSGIELLRAEDGVQRLLDGLRSHCWFERESDSLGTMTSVFHTITGEELGRRPTREELSEIRIHIISLLRRLVNDGDGVTYEELQAIVFYLEDCSDDKQKLDVLRLLLDLMICQGPRVFKFLSDLQDSNSAPNLLMSLQRRPALKLKQYHTGDNRRQGIDVFLNLLRSPEDGCRVVALQAIGKLLRSGVKLDPAELFPAMYRILRVYNLSAECYIALFSIMLSEDLKYHEGANGIGLDGTQTVLHAPALPLILKLLRNTESVDLTQSIMQDMYFLLMNDVNKALLLQQFGWQCWLLHLIIDVPLTVQSKRRVSFAKEQYVADHREKRRGSLSSSKSAPNLARMSSKGEIISDAGDLSAPPPSAENEAQVKLDMYTNDEEKQDGSSGETIVEPESKQTNADDEKSCTGSEAQQAEEEQEKETLEMQGRVAVQSYALKLLLSQLLFALKLPNGWKTYEATLAWVFIVLEDTPGVVGLATAMLNELKQLVERDAELVEESELGSLVDNIDQCILITEDCILARIHLMGGFQPDAMSLLGSPSRVHTLRASTSYDGLRPNSTPQGVGRSLELEMVWPLMSSLLDLADWTQRNRHFSKVFRRGGGSSTPTQSRWRLNSVDSADSSTNNDLTSPGRAGTHSRRSSRSSRRSPSSRGRVPSMHEIMDSTVYVARNRQPDWNKSRADLFLEMACRLLTCSDDDLELELLAGSASLSLTEMAGKLELPEDRSEVLLEESLAILCSCILSTLGVAGALRQPPGGGPSDLEDPSSTTAADESSGDLPAADRSDSHHGPTNTSSAATTGHGSNVALDLTPIMMSRGSSSAHTVSPLLSPMDPLSITRVAIPEDFDRESGFASAVALLRVLLSLYRQFVQGVSMKGNLRALQLPPIDPTLLSDDELVSVLQDEERWVEATTSVRLPTQSLQQDVVTECSGRIRRFKLVTTSLREQQAQHLHSEDMYFHKTQERMETVFNEHRQREANRRSVLGSERVRDRRRVIREWHIILRNLMNERGPWSVTKRPRRSRRKLKSNAADSSSSEDDEEDGCKEEDEVIYWKMDKTENHSRMRLKLKRNFDGSDHKEASPEYGVDGDSEENEESLNQPEKSKLLLSAMKLSRAISNGPGEAEDDEEEWEKIEDEKDGEGEESEYHGSVILEEECDIISPVVITSGSLVLTASHLSFEAREAHTHDKKKVDLDSKSMSNARMAKDKKWNLDNLRCMYYRRYQLRRNSMELFFANQTNVFFHFESEKVLKRVFSRIIRLRPKKLQWKQVTRSGNNASLLQKSGITEDWVRRRISNFDYLMHLNTVAGRTYNDLTQYPVFPWVLSDYTSDSIDLSDPSVYRDLSKPMGAINEKRLEMFVERYNTLEDETMPKFHYGTHYSSAGTTLFYLLRMEPFTTQAILMQDGHFDHADRLFHSIAMTWHGVSNNAADVKELIPEFYYSPEFLRNSNRFVMGVRQADNAPIDDVVLPPWAKGDPHEFVRIMREALESEYVSQNLHHWVDLIFGFKQTGQAAVDAHNVFFHLTYEGAVNIDEIEDQALRDATIAQIEHFGQTPSQLLKTPHPRRCDPESMILSIFQRLDDLELYMRPYVTQKVQQENPLLFIFPCNERVLTVGLDRVLGIHRWKANTPEYVPPFQFEVEKKNSTRLIGVHFAIQLLILPSFFAVSVDERYLLSCGHWDSSFKVSSSDSGQTLQSISQHKDIVTCLDITEDGEFVATGSRDTTVMVWEFASGAEKGEILRSTPKHVLYGHDDEVTCVAASVDLDLIVSGSKDGSVIIHTCRKGHYVRSLYPPDGSGLRWVGISSAGFVVAYSYTNLSLHLYSINGDHRCSIDTGERLYAFCFSRDGKFLVTGGDHGTVKVRRIHDLEVIQKFKPLKSTIRALSTTSDEQHLLVGLLSGRMLIYALNARYLRQRALKKLATLGF